ncbi:GGDEF domain-containing protein [Ectopseudomonas hydrolytica]|nr:MULTISPECIES: sensor domain-containing diguanylate cyclase [Pseudomonas]ARS51008.1 diguanylate cyclase [Pseudomonas mendocina]EJO94476.1 PAS/PAC sensor-containing diguanylate cyclase [Pseudomonas mendocina DLHK]ATH80179.1 GGDEF domain-containing protein [Pseudomonas mendocina]MBA4242537.1 cellulose biosynthesis regulator YedQ [Pseudomonas sp.]MBF8161964.1 sensor domain-containing diguanylate cyclase [Pseudomonas mendocina]
MDDQGNGVSELEELTLALLHSRAEVERLREREQLFSSLLGSVNAALWAFDWDEQRVIYVSPAYERIFGRSAALLLADYGEWRNSIYPDDLDYAAESLAKVLETGAVEFREYRIIRSDGQLRWLSDKCFVSPRSAAGQGHVIVGIAEDITEKKRLEGELHRLATTDVLTQSSNRRHFFECARREFEHARKFGSPLAFLLLDLDDFKKINDQYGHQLGDQVLQRLAQCGANALRRGDLFGRIGGEEFAALFPGCEPDVALQVAERLQREVQRLSFQHEGVSFGITVSQGLTSMRAADVNLDALYARADAAMYLAKRQGKNQIVLG